MPKKQISDSSSDSSDYQVSALRAASETSRLKFLILNLSIAQEKL